MTRPLSFVLGAILSATDAVAALSITKWLNLSEKTITILEGESLLNDASALTAYHFALAAVWWTTFVAWEAGYEFLVLIGGGLIVWLVLGKLLRIMLRITKNNTMVAISFTLLMPFITYLVAELIHVSGVIAVVAMGIFVTVFTNNSQNL
jgi:CPA1 family monovalent cation:H+ antiporter